MKVRYITGHKEGEAFCQSLRFPSLLALDIETYNVQGYSALDFLTSKISTIQIGTQDVLAVLDIIKMGSIPLALKDILRNESTKLIIHNASFEYKMFRYTEGIEINNFFCTQIAESMLKNGVEFRFSLKETLSRRLDVELPKELGKSDWGKRPLSKVQLAYALNDVRYLIPLYLEQMAAFAKYRTKPEEISDMEKNFQVEMDALPFFCETEYNGVYFNLDKVKVLEEKYTKAAEDKLAAIQEALPPVPLTDSDAKKKKLREMYPDGVKPVTSNRDFKEAFKLLGVKLPTLVNRKTRKESESLSAKTYHLVNHPVGKMIQEYTEVKKLLTSYIKPMLRKTNDAKPGWIHPLTGRAHPSIKQNGQVTARPAYQAPPLQTIPKTVEFREIVEVKPSETV